MPRPRKEMPEYRYHVSGQARVYIDGKYYYLGTHDSPQSKAKYRRLIAKYLENDCRMPSHERERQSEESVTVACVTAEFREHNKIQEPYIRYDAFLSSQHERHESSNVSHVG